MYAMEKIKKLKGLLIYVVGIFIILSSEGWKDRGCKNGFSIKIVKYKI